MMNRMSAENKKVFCYLFTLWVVGMLVIFLFGGCSVTPTNPEYVFRDMPVKHMYLRDGGVYHNVGEDKILENIWLNNVNYIVLDENGDFVHNPTKEYIKELYKDY